MWVHPCLSVRAVTRTPPAHWIQHTGPHQWFTVSHPASWKSESTPTGIVFSAPEGGVLSLQSLWLDSDRALPLARLADYGQMFRRTRRVRNLNDPEIGQRSLAVEGEGVVERRVPWYRRLFRRKDWRRWRIWGAVYEHVNVVAMYLAPASPDPEAATIAGMIVSSLEFREKPACPPEVFTQRVLELVRRKYPALPCQSTPDFQIKLGDSKVNLFNFYRSYVNAPDQLEQIILPALTTVVQVQEWGKSQTDPELESVRRRIMPMLYPETVWNERFPDLVGSSWVAGLVVLYVVDESHAYWYIREELMQGWQISVEDLHEIALENLARYFDDQPMEFSLAGETEGPRLLMPARPDAYNAVRLLSEPFLDRLREVLATPFAVGIPSRDFLVGVSLHSPEAVDHVRQRVADDFKVMDHPLCNRLLLVTHDGVTELADADEPLGSDD